MTDVVDRIQAECMRKHRYTSSRAAGAVAAKSRREGAPKLRAYECPWCGGWHLTKRVEVPHG